VPVTAIVGGAALIGVVAATLPVVRFKRAR
jgi:hypothetical protein